MTISVFKSISPICSNFDRFRLQTGRLILHQLHHVWSICRVPAAGLSECAGHRKALVQVQLVLLLLDVGSRLHLAANLLAWHTQGLLVRLPIPVSCTLAPTLKNHTCYLLIVWSDDIFILRVNVQQPEHFQVLC